MFIDDRPFCEYFFWKVCENSCLIFILQTRKHEGTPCQRISFFEDLFHFLIFFNKCQKGRHENSLKGDEFLITIDDPMI